MKPNSATHVCQVRLSSFCNNGGDEFFVSSWERSQEQSRNGRTTCARRGDGDVGLN